MIGGFILGGGGGGLSQVIVRGIGPSLTGFGVTDALADPLLELHNGNGDLIDSNDNWMDNPAEAEIEATMDPADPHNLHDTADKPVWERIDIATAGNDCDECVRALREPLMKIDGVKEVIADPKTENVWVTFDARKTHAPELHDAILRSGYKPAPTAE